LNQFSANRGFPAGNPIANALVIIVGSLVIGASLVLGFVAFIVLSVILMILAAVVGIRLWWFRRKFAKSGASPDATPRGPRGPGGVIEGEYKVVIEERDQQ
jgi:hypothetical protein